jgi:hypothetical protein
VLNAIFRATDHYPPDSPRITDLPKRLFRSLASKQKTNANIPSWTARDHPLPFLEFLVASGHIDCRGINAHDGYALTKAVRAGFIPLVRFLIDRGASPRYKEALSVKVAIQKKDLSLVRMLIERDDPDAGRKGRSKRRRLEDRVPVNPSMVRVAVECDARDIVDYLIKERGCVPDIRTLHMI